MNKSQTSSGAPGFVLELESVRAQLIWANHREVEPEYHTQRIRLGDEAGCWYITHGGVTFTKDGRENRARTGEWVFPGTDETEIRFTPGTRIISIRFRLLHRSGKPLYVIPRPLRFSGAEIPEVKKRAEPLLASLTPWQRSGTLLLGRERIPLARNLEVEAHFLHWLGAYVDTLEAYGMERQSAEPGDPRVEKALGLIDAHPMREPYHEPDIAAQCGVSTSQLRRLFQKELGTSPFAVYDRRRLDLARHALHETQLPMKEVAYELGFRTSSHFSNWFKKRQGRGPREFRKGSVERLEGERGEVRI